MKFTLFVSIPFLASLAFAGGGDISKTGCRVLNIYKNTSSGSKRDLLEASLQCSDSNGRVYVTTEDSDVKNILVTALMSKLKIEFRGILRSSDTMIMHVNITGEY